MYDSLGGGSEFELLVPALVGLLRDRNRPALDLPDLPIKHPNMILAVFSSLATLAFMAGMVRGPCEVSDTDPLANPPADRLAAVSGARSALCHRAVTYSQDDAPIRAYARRC